MSTPTYGAVHSALHRRRGSASRQACVICGRRARVWACYPCADADVIEGRNADGRRVTYVADLDGYAPMCFPHANAHDRERTARTAATAHLALSPKTPKPPGRRPKVKHSAPIAAAPALFDFDTEGAMR